MNNFNNLTSGGVKSTPSRRIEYIDAMRGFTMLLVVLAHVATFGLDIFGGESVTSYHMFLRQFRMPLFFFVSGFVLFKSGAVWNLSSACKFLRKKVSVQILSPLLFLSASILTRHIAFPDALFEYYMFYIVLHALADVCRMKSCFKDAFLLLVSLGLYVFTVPTMIGRWPVTQEISSLVGIPVWSYFFFFMLGTRVRKHFSTFEKALDETPLLMWCIVIYFGFNLCGAWVKQLSHTGFNLLVSLSGLIIVIALFRRNRQTFSSERRVGRIFQYVGRRTLDIYLIHYFFVFSNMQAVLPDFGKLNSPFLEFAISLIIAIGVIAASLTVSHVLRLSPVLAHYLFGQKRMKA
ncbi:MAG: acyltransferase [Clostridium sp.]|nr:acyltransferase [Clostridium sp.]